ncbi:MAG: iron ABC transporter permease [Candidatus Heimdallarchaeota archaeon]|nr:iron ABC transporter permease [Candidatus Heimdallarchaeota archaeon]MCK4770261.1 iron ABC transporter permease [Candidatus Heimdallarchaeota archaeon]
MMLNKFKEKYSRDEFTNSFIIILAVIILGTFLLSLFFIPLFRILQYAFYSDSQFSFSMFFSTISNSTNLIFLARDTLAQALISTVFCLLIGIPASYFFAKYDFKGRKVIINLLTVPFVLPPIVVLLGFIVAYGEGGWVNVIWRNIFNTENSLISIFGTYQGIIFAHVFYNLSVIIRMTIPAWESLDFDQIEVARSLGASNWRIFRRIIFPQIINYIISAALLVFVYTFNSFAIVLFLGEARFQTLEVRIFKQMKDSLNFSGGASLAIIQLLVNTLIIILYLWFERKTRQMALGKEKGLQKTKLRFSKRNWKINLRTTGIILFIILIGLFTFAPIFAVIIESFIPFSEGVSSLWGYKQLLSNEHMNILNNSPLRLLLNTLLFAVVATIITLILSLLIVLVLRNRYESLRKYRKPLAEGLISYMIILPMATSSITLAIGLFLQYRNTIIYQSAVWLFIILSHVLISIPFATRSILSAYNRIDIELLNVASTLGASRLRIFRKIELPMMMRGILVGGIFSFAISLGEFGATNFLVRDVFGTLSIGISKLITSQTLQLPATMASILIIITVLCFLIIQKIGEVELKV